MTKSKTIVLWDCNGKLEATLFASRRKAFSFESVKDQLGMIAVKASCTEQFDSSADYLIRQVLKNGRIETQLVFGTLPSWAGGTLRSPRCLIASGSETTRLLKKYPPAGYADSQTRRINGIHGDDDCMGK